MPRIFKYVLIGAASLVGLVMLAIAVALLIPNNIYKGWLTEAVQKATGRTLTIGENFDIQVGTNLKLIAGDVRFGNAEWGTRPTLLSAEQLEADVQLLPLLSGVVAVSLNANGPQVLIETDASGVGNWVMKSDIPRPEPKPPRAGTGAGFVIAPSVQITDGQFDYRDGRSGRTEQLDLSSFDLNTADAHLSIALRGVYKGQTVSLSGDLGNTHKIATGETTEVNLEGQLGETALAAQGNWSELLAAAGPTLDLTLTVNNPSVDTLTPFAGVTIPKLGALNIGSQVAGSDGAYAAKDFKLKLEGPATKVVISGAVDNLVKLNGIELGAQASARSLPDIVEGFDLQLPVSVPRAIEATAAVSGSLAALALKDLVVKIDDEHLQAKVTGSAQDIIARKGVQATVDLDAPSLTALSKFVGRELPTSGPVTAGAQLASHDDTYEISALKVSVAGENINADLSGSIADLLAVSGINLDLDVRVGSLAQFSAAAGTELPDTSPLTIKAKATATEGASGPAQISADLQSDWLKGRIDATLADVLAARTVEGDLDVELKSITVLSAIASRELPPMGPIKASGHLTSTGETYALTDLNVVIEDQLLKAQIKGSVNDLLGAGGIDLDLEAKFGSLANFSALAGTELPETKPLNIKAKAVANKGAQGPAEINADVQSEWLTANVEATMADLLKAQGFAGNIILELQSLADLSSVAGRELPAMGPVKASAKLASSGETYALSELDLDINDQVLRAQVKGSVTDLLAAQGIDLAMEGTVSSLADLSQLTGAELPDTPSIVVDAKLVAKEGIQGQTAIKANLSTDKVKADVDGTITDLTTAAAVNMDLALKAVSLADVGELAGTELPQVGPLDASATVSVAANEIDLTTVVVTMGNSDLQGNLKVSLPTQGSKGNATGLFKSKRFDLDQLLASLPDSSASEKGTSAAGSGPSAPTAPQSQSKQTQETASGGEPLASRASVNSGARVFPDDPLPVEFLSSYDAFIEFSIDKLKTPDTMIENGRVTVNIKDSALKLDLHRASVGGRAVAGALTLDASRQPAPMTIGLHADAIQLSDVVGQNTLLQGGQLFVDIDARGSGNSMSEIMGTLNGHASLVIKDSRLSGQALSRFGGDILNQINPLSAQRGYSEIECAAAAFDIIDGIAKTPRGLVIRGRTATWVGSGEINLKTEQLNISLKSKARKGIGMSAGSLASIIQMSGTLANPTLTPNPVGVAKAGAGAALALTTGGLSVLAAGLLDRVTSEQGICEAILETIILGKNPTESGKAEAAGRDN